MDIREKLGAAPQNKEALEDYFLHGSDEEIEEYSEEGKTEDIENMEEYINEVQEEINHKDWTPSIEKIKKKRNPLHIRMNQPNLFIFISTLIFFMIVFYMFWTYFGGMNHV